MTLAPSMNPMSMLSGRRVPLRLATSPDAFRGVRPVRGGTWFGHGPINTAPFFPVTPTELAEAEE
jgi:hypothetical protein